MCVANVTNPDAKEPDTPKPVDHGPSPYSPCYPGCLNCVGPNVVDCLVCKPNHLMILTSASGPLGYCVANWLW